LGVSRKGQVQSSSCVSSGAVRSEIIEIAEETSTMRNRTVFTTSGGRQKTLVKITALWGRGRLCRAFGKLVVEPASVFPGTGTGEHCRTTRVSTVVLSDRHSNTRFIVLAMTKNNSAVSPQTLSPYLLPRGSHGSMGQYVKCRRNPHTIEDTTQIDSFSHQFCP
jgi:hypothetical protein